MTGRRCDGCKFWKAREDQSPPNPHADDVEGDCRRMPPQFLSSVLAFVVREDELTHEESDSEFRFQSDDVAFSEAASFMTWGQPVTKGDDWCGEWQAAEAEGRAK